MGNLLTPNDVLDGITKIIIVNPLFKGMNLNVTLIANEYAGSFTQKRKSVKQKLLLQDAVEKSSAKESVVKSVTKKLMITQYSGHGEKLTYEIIDGIVEKKNKDEFNLIVTAGGDGTSLEVQTALFKSAQKSKALNKIIMDDVAILRLPLGTGCDGTDGHTFEQTIELLENPIHFANARAVKVWHEGQPTKEDFERAGKNPANYGNEYILTPWYAFNMAGAGVDAYVCYATNRMKAKIPGNSYSLWVDLSSLFYDKSFPAAIANMKIYDEDDNLVEELNQKFEMLVLASSGHRFFGGGKNILPDDGNLGIVRRLSPFELAVHNRQVNDGRYTQTGIGKTYKAHKIVIDYDESLLVELDGETHLLVKESFPLIMEVTEPCIQVLESDSLEWDKGTVRK